MKSKAYVVALLAVFTALAMILSLFDNLLSAAVPIPLPGFKIGIANFITLFLVLYFPLPHSLCVVFMRCFLSSLYGGGITVFLISLSGGVLSTLLMYFIKRTCKSSVTPVGISIAGAAAHNTGQVLMVILLLMSPAYIYYLPLLLVLSIFTGFVIGAAGSGIYPRINFILKRNKKL